MGKGKIIAIIGGILGILSVVLFYVLPDIFSFWHFVGGGAGLYLGGFGFWDGTGMDPEYAEDILLLIIFVVIVAGGAIAIIGGLIENKVAGILGGILMLAGPILLIVALATEMGDFKDLAAIIEFATGEKGLLFGSFGPLDWGIWISTYLALGAGIVGVIGGATS